MLRNATWDVESVSRSTPRCSTGSRMSWLMLRASLEHFSCSKPALSPVVSGPE